MQELTQSTNDIIYARTTWNFDNVPVLFLQPHSTEKKKRPKRVPEDENAPRMVTIKELAKLTGITEYCIRGLCKRNEINYIKTGTKILINHQRFLEYMDRKF